MTTVDKSGSPRNSYKHRPDDNLCFKDNCGTRNKLVS